MTLDDIVQSLDGSRRPLLVCDIDEVVLEFLDPFQDYLASVDHRLHPDSFRLHGNIRHVAHGGDATDEMVHDFQEAFFASQRVWQRPARDAKAVLDRLAGQTDIVFLTAMPPRHRDARRQLLDDHAFGFPMIATEEPKGPVVARLMGQRGVPAAFIDDLAHNLHSVAEHAPDCLLVNLMANQVFRKLAPVPGETVRQAADWLDAERLVRGHFGLD